VANWGGLNNALFSWRNGVNQLFPHRSTRSDGGRADSNHASTSQHQPDSDGTVDAFDEDRNYLASSDQDGNVWEDRIKTALDADFMADPRWQLIISDRKIRNPDIRNGAARDYLGDSPHTEHTHRQVRQSKEDDGRAWKFTHTKAVLREMERALVADTNVVSFSAAARDVLKAEATEGSIGYAGGGLPSWTGMPANRNYLNAFTQLFGMVAALAGQVSALQASHAALQSDMDSLTHDPADGSEAEAEQLPLVRAARYVQQNPPPA
jgi:hypothetical protein